MTEPPVVAQLRRLIDEAESALAASPSVAVLLPFALEIARLTASLPSQRRLIESELLGIVRIARRGPHELVALAAHLLRSPSLRAEIEADHRAAVMRPDHRAEPILRQVLEAFDDSWSDAEMYPALPVRVLDISFQPAEFTVLLTAAAGSLVESCRESFCDPPPPQRFAFVLGSEPRRIVSVDAALRHLLLPDGSFRDWINLSPVGVHDGATILEIEHAAKFTHRLLIGKMAFRFEPFHLIGPSLPPDADGTPPIPKVSLPPLSLG